MGASHRVLPYPVTGASGPVFPSSAAQPNERAEWGYCGFTLTNKSSVQTYRITFTSEAGDIVDILELDPGETRSDWYGPQGITFGKRLNVAFLPDDAVNEVVGSVRVG